MIERYVEADALDAGEDMLLVPIAAGAVEATDGFAKQVMERYQDVQKALEARDGLDEGEFLMIGGMGGRTMWVPAYTIVLAGIHRRQANGWEHSADTLEGVLDRISNIYMPDTMATAGIPGTGFSGVKGNADPDAIREVLVESRLRISVYNEGFAHDSAKRLEADPPKIEHEAAAAPAEQVLVG